MTHRVIAALAVAAALAGCARMPTITFGSRPEGTPWNPEQVRELAYEIETSVARAGQYSDAQAAQQVGTELEFGEEQVDPAALLGAMDELERDIPLLSELHIDTPEVVSAIRARQLRAPSLAEWKDRGCLGENREGKVVYVPCKACETDDVLAERLAFIIIKENRARRTIYDQLRVRNAWSSDRDAEIWSLFGEVHAELAEPTHYVQRGTEWVRDREPSMGEVAEEIPTIGGPRTLNDETWDEAEVFDDEWATVPPRAIPQR